MGPLGWLCTLQQGFFVEHAERCVGLGERGNFFFKDLDIDHKFSFTTSKNKFWRHITMQLNEESNTFRLFLDGVQALETPLCTDSGFRDAAEVDAHTQTNRALQFDGTRWKGSGQRAAIADVRWYVHSDDADGDGRGDGPLTAPQIYEIARSQAPSSFKDTGCLPYTSPLLEDQRFKDNLGHDCKWYHQAKAVKPQVCEYQAAAKSCVTSCQSRLECFEGNQTKREKIYFAFDRIHLMTPAHANGSICIGQGLKKKEVVQECVKWMSSKTTGTLGGRGVSAEHDHVLYHWLRITDAKFRDEHWMSAAGAHVNITDCEQLETAIDEGCRFDMQQVKEFTNEIKDSDGWSIGFWVKSVGAKSLTVAGKFEPGLSLLHSISPPKPFFGLNSFLYEGEGIYTLVYAGTDPVRQNPRDNFTDLMRDGLPVGTVVREGSGWCMGRDAEVKGRAPYSFKTCWEHCAKQLPDTIAINGLPEKCFCQESCETMDCDDGQTIITSTNVALGLCSLTEPPWSHGQFEELSTSEWNFVAFSNGFAGTSARRTLHADAVGSFAMHNSFATQRRDPLPNNIGEAFFKAIEVYACANGQ